MKKLILIAVMGLVGVGLTPKANASWDLWWSWHYDFYGNHATRTLLNGDVVAGQGAPGGNCQTIHHVSGLVFHNTGPFCSTLQEDTFEVQLCDGGDPPSGCVTKATFTKQAVWNSNCSMACNDFIFSHCGDEQHIMNYAVGVLNTPCLQ